MKEAAEHLEKAHSEGADMKQGVAQILAVCMVKQGYEEQPQKMGEVTEKQFSLYTDRYAQELQDPKNPKSKAFDWMMKSKKADAIYQIAHDSVQDGAKLKNEYILAASNASKALGRGVRSRSVNFGRQKEMQPGNSSLT